MELAYSIYTTIFLSTMLFAYLGVGVLQKANNTVVATKEEWWYWGTAICIYTLVLGLREDVGIDYTSYKNIFSYLLNYGMEAKNTDFIYYMFVPIVKNTHYNVFIAFLAFITIYFLFLSLRELPEILLLYLFFFFTFLTFFTSLNTMRQNAASFVAFFAILKYLQMDYKRFIAYFFLAFCLHRFVIVLLPFVFLFKYDFLKPRWVQYFLWFSCMAASNRIFQNFQQFIVSLPLTGYENMSYIGYLENFAYRTQRVLEWGSVSEGTGLFQYLIIFINCFAIYYSKELKIRFKHYYFTVFYNFFIIGTILDPILSLNEATDRAIHYFLFYGTYVYSVLFYFILNTNRKNLYLIKIGFVGIMFIGVAFFYVTIYRGSMGITPFQFL